MSTKKIKRPESTFFNMVLTLLLLTLIFGVALAYVNQLTIGPKEQVRLKKKLEAMAEVLPAFDNDPLQEVVKVAVPDSKDTLEIYTAKQGEKVVGKAVTCFSDKGYSERINVIVGLNNENAIYGVKVLSQKETPGLGAKITSTKFKQQYIGKKAGAFNFDVKKDGGEIDAITGATISSRAFSGAVMQALGAVEGK